MAMLTPSTLLGLACIVLTLGGMVAALIYFAVRDRRALRQGHALSDPVPGNRA